MNLIVVKKDELVKAFQRWNVDVIENPNKHENPSDTLEDAESQVDAMISHITDGHIDEAAADVRINTVSSFMEHCKSEGIDISDIIYETFFGA